MNSTSSVVQNSQENLQKKQEEMKKVLENKNLTKKNEKKESDFKIETSKLEVDESMLSKPAPPPAEPVKNETSVLPEVKKETKKVVPKMEKDEHSFQIETSTIDADDAPAQSAGQRKD